MPKKTSQKKHLWKKKHLREETNKLDYFTAFLSDTARRGKYCVQLPTANPGCLEHRCRVVSQHSVSAPAERSHGRVGSINLFSQGNVPLLGNVPTWYRATPDTNCKPRIQIRTNDVTASRYHHITRQCKHLSLPIVTPRIKIRVTIKAAPAEPAFRCFSLTWCQFFFLPAASLPNSPLRPYRNSLCTKLRQQISFHYPAKARTFENAQTGTSTKRLFFHTNVPPLRVKWRLEDSSARTR